MRAPLHTPAEVKTSEAIELTARFTRQLSPSDVARVRRVHDWVHAGRQHYETSRQAPAPVSTPH